MSERYNARRLRREWEARVASGEKPRDPRQNEIDAQAAFERRRARRTVAGSPRADLLCSHGVPWLDCLACSTPRSRP